MRVRKIVDYGTMRLTEEQLLRSFDAIKQNGAGKTTAEWAEALGVSTGRALALLKKADAAGKVRRATKVVMRFDGRPFTVSTYVVLKGGAK